MRHCTEACGQILVWSVEVWRGVDCGLWTTCGMVRWKPDGSGNKLTTNFQEFPNNIFIPSAMDLTLIQKRSNSASNLAKMTVEQLVQYWSCTAVRRAAASDRRTVETGERQQGLQASRDQRALVAECSFLSTFRKETARGWSRTNSAAD